MKKPSLAERVTGAMFWNSALLPVKTALSFVSSVIVVRALTQSDYAAFTAIIALVTTIGQWSDLGIENTIAKFLPEIEQRFGRRDVVRFLGILLLFKFALLTPILIGVSIFWARLDISQQFGVNDPVYLVLIALLLLLGVVSDYIIEFLISYFNQKGTNTMEVVNGLVQPLLVIAFISLGWGVPGVLWARVWATVLYIVIGLVFARANYAELAHAGDLKGNWKSIWRRFARLCGVAYFSSVTLYFSDLAFVVFVLTYFNDVVGIALFSVAYSRVLAPIRQFLTNALWGVPVPMFARLYVQRDFVKLQEAYASLSRFMTLLLVPSAVGLCILAPNLIRLFFQARYEPAASIAIILVIFLFGESLFQAAPLVLVAFEEVPILFSGRGLTLLTIPLLFVVVPPFGAVGAAWVIGAVRLGSRLYFTAMIMRKFKLSFPFGFFFKVSAATAIMAAGMFLALGLERPHDVTETAIRTTVAFLVGSIVFLVTFKRLGSIESSDRARLSTLRLPFKRILLNWL